MQLVDAYEAGAIGLDELKTRSEAVRLRIERARRDVEQAERALRETTHLRAVVTRLEDFTARVRTGLDSLSWIERRHIIRTVVAKIEIDEHGATIVYRVPGPDGTPPTPSSGTEQSESGSNAEVVNCEQVVIGRFIADFAAPTARLVVEVDGEYPSRRRTADARRDRVLRRLGYRVLRFEAELVLRHPEQAVALIRAALV